MEAELVALRIARQTVEDSLTRLQREAHRESEAHTTHAALLGREISEGEVVQHHLEDEIALLSRRCQACQNHLAVAPSSRAWVTRAIMDVRRICKIRMPCSQRRPSGSTPRMWR